MVVHNKVCFINFFISFSGEALAPVPQLLTVYSIFYTVFSTWLCCRLFLFSLHQCYKGQIVCRHENRIELTGADSRVLLCSILFVNRLEFGNSVVVVELSFLSWSLLGVHLYLIYHWIKNYQTLKNCKLGLSYVLCWCKYLR